MIKRLNYFNHQFLEEQDFRDEQYYHLEMRRRLNRSLHIWGIAEGLDVSRRGDREITVEPGFAIDPEGRELLVVEPISREIGPSEHHHKELHVLLSHKERMDAADLRSSDGVEGYNRVTEHAEVEVTHEKGKFGSGVLLATVHLEAGNIHRIDHAGRQAAGSLIAPNSVHARHIADGSLTEPKLAAGLKDSLRLKELPDGSVTLQKLAPEIRTALGAGGWVRLPFKPVSLRPKGHRPHAEEREFHADIAYAYCDGRGASGTMALPIPAGATAVREFRIAGTSSGSKIRVELIRTGWNPKDKKGEFTEILNKEFVQAEFDQKFPADRDLDDFHALSLAVTADGEAEIWLVAARFQ